MPIDKTTTTEDFEETVNAFMLEEAKKELKHEIIAENGEEYYYELIAERTEKLHSFKKAGDFVFGKNDNAFREEVIKATLHKNKDLEKSMQMYELVMTEISLDVFLNI